MADDLEYLWRRKLGGKQEPVYTAAAVLIFALIDGMAGPEDMPTPPAGSNARQRAQLRREHREKKRQRYYDFLEDHFTELCAVLHKLTGRPGDDVLYQEYRNGLVHLYWPKKGYALARDAQCSGAYAAKVPAAGQEFIAINMDRLIEDFIALARRFARNKKLRWWE